MFQAAFTDELRKIAVTAGTDGAVAHFLKAPGLSWDSVLDGGVKAKEPFVVKARPKKITPPLATAAEHAPPSRAAA